MDSAEDEIGVEIDWFDVVMECTSGKFWSPNFDLQPPSVGCYNFRRLAQDESDVRGRQLVTVSRRG